MTFPGIRRAVTCGAETQTVAVHCCAIMAGRGRIGCELMMIIVCTCADHAHYQRAGAVWHHRHSVLHHHQPGTHRPRGAELQDLLRYQASQVPLSVLYAHSAIFLHVSWFCRSLEDPLQQCY